MVFSLKVGLVHNKTRFFGICRRNWKHWRKKILKMFEIISSKTFRKPIFLGFRWLKLINSETLLLSILSI